MRAMDTSSPQPLRNRLQGAVLAAMLLGLLLQAALGAAAFARRQARLWLAPGGQAPTQAAATEDPVALVARELPSASPVLYVTADAGDEETWAYFQLSYRLYPAPVWWVASAPHASEVDWWISSPVDGPALEALARAKGADYIVFDRVGVPAMFPSASSLKVGRQTAIVVLSKAGGR